MLEKRAVVYMSSRAIDYAYFAMFLWYFGTISVEWYLFLIFCFICKWIFQISLEE